MKTRTIFTSACLIALLASLLAGSSAMRANSQEIFAACAPGQSCAYAPVILRGYLCSGELSGIVVDATTAEPIEGVHVSVDGTGLSASTSPTGTYTLAAVPYGEQVVTASVEGYVTISQEVQITCGMQNQLNFALSPTMPPTEMRIVLIWGENPRDLDSHMWLPQASYYHVCWFQPGSATAFPYANLDVDDTSSFGPETITIHQWYPGTYTYAVQHWAGLGDLITSSARVHVYKGDDLIATYDVPGAGSGAWWYLFDIDGSTLTLTTHNEIVADPPYDPYPCVP